MALEKSQIINDIISKRKTTAAEPKQKQEKLKSLEASLRKLKTQKQTLLEKPGITPKLIERLKQINFSVLIEEAIQEQQVWENLWKRFERNSINIGVVGLARQGKSTFLQAVSGLTDNEIPSSDGQPCTTVQSNIFHSEGITSGVVHFHSEKSFLEEVIEPYYQALGFPNPPQTLTQFRNVSLPSMPINHGQLAKIESLYKHLKDEYHLNFDKYANSLKPEKWRKEIAQSEIKQYVSQEYDSNSNPKFFNHLAVEKVEVSCSFPKVDVQQIALVDMPGLGDTRLGDAERMISALSQDVDFILFIRRPNKMGDFWGEKDINLYDTASKALEEKLPLEEWSFMLLNYDGENRQRCKDFENTREQKGIRVKQCLTANCNNSIEANQVLEQVLEYLVENIVRLDRQYISASLSSLKSLQSKVEQELTRAKELIEDYGDGHAEYVSFRENLVKQLYEKIEDFREKTRLLKDQPSKEFINQVDIAITNCQDNPGFPSSEEIKVWIKKEGIPNEPHFRAIQQMRATFLQHFHFLEIELKDFLNKTKLEIVEIFVDLGLGNLNNKQGLESLKAMANELNDSFPKLKLGFKFLASFEISYRGFLQSKVWQEISDNSIFPLPLGQPFNGSFGNVEDIILDLKQRHQKAIIICQETLKNLALSITNVQISMVEEFADHITRAKDIEQEWDILLGKYRSQVWTEFKDLEERKELQQQWNSLVKEAFLENQKLN
ncbi:hypothetical protein Sta7437_4889 (plasmid) [Stanieria cyanosphaera PCC 7437]|uniref:Dynamin N-terminal domain-containing protein n=1 Tax=Stanieria cyanosphaera (strain ATCC 29371 / PCC 7437) TaxID=111780 RepID=K9Y2Q9_STAC7|nr:dynamin family protein [Stanieria cyanosphaera]AFZ38317.1 hypothetical protein Sta7437_4889 [Stanieria cyanosphaera PCC 7437]